jgi:hypothetical protein
MPARIAARSSLIAAGRQPQLNRNVERGPLRSGRDDFGWGYGVHAHSELVFPLPEAVQSLRGKVGLDRIAGRGGCVRARVFANDTKSPPLWESPLLVGSDSLADLGTIALGGPNQNERELVLQVDAAHDGRPAGADPLDVRDTADWFDVTLALDPAAVEREAKSRAIAQLAGLDGWSVRAAPGGTIDLKNDWYEPHNVPGSFRLSIAARNEPLVISRQAKLKSADRWLVVFAHRATGGAPVRLEVRLNGETVAKHEVPERRRGDDDQPPLAVSLASYQDSSKPVDIEIRQLAAEQGFVDWRMVQFAETLPGGRP